MEISFSINIKNTSISIVKIYIYSLYKVVASGNSGFACLNHAQFSSVQFREISEDVGYVLQLLYARDSNRARAPCVETIVLLICKNNLHVTQPARHGNALQLGILSVSRRMSISIN